MVHQAEVVLVDKGPDGVIRGQYSVGWAMLPLFELPGAPVGAGSKQPLHMPLMAGTPRYLMFRYGVSSRFVAAVVPITFPDMP